MMFRYSGIVLGFFALVVLWPLFSRATEYASTNFRIRDPILQIATSTQMSSTNFRLTGVAGQPAIGTSSATSFRASSGFLFFPSVAKPTVKKIIGDGEVGLHWTSVSGFLGWTVGGYDIGRATASGGPYSYTSVGAHTYSAGSAATSGLTNGTTYYFVVRAEDIFGNAVATSSEIAATPAASSYRVITGDFSSSAASSTNMTQANGTSILVDMPAGVLSSGISIHPEFSSFSKDTVVADKPLPSGKLGGTTMYELSFFQTSDLIQISSLDKAVTLTFHYTDADVSGITGSTLAAYRWNGSSWVTLSGSTVDTAARTVTVTSSSFSTFALLGTAASNSSPSAAPAASAARGGSGGGGGGGGLLSETPTSPATTKVSLKGFAYPGAAISVLKDGQIAASSRADENGNWSADAPVSGGVYMFSVYATDSDGRKSLTYGFPISVSALQSVSISDIIVSPTIGADKQEVKFGNTITFFGYTYPASVLHVMINSDTEIADTVKANALGRWKYALNSDNLEKGEHAAKSQTETAQKIVSPFSETLGFRVGDADVAFGAGIRPASRPLAERCGKNGDLNNDGKVNIIDFSIMLFFWNQRNPKNACADANRDGIVNLFDFSIMLYWWTG